MDALSYLSIRQPWASLLVSGKKMAENRNWTTTFRGWLAIHTGAKADEDCDGICEDMEEELGIDVDKLPHADVRGAVIGLAYLADVFGDDIDEMNYVNEHYFTEGPVVLWLPSAFPIIKPIPFKANVGIRPLPEGISGALRETYSHMMR